MITDVVQRWTLGREYRRPASRAALEAKIQRALAARDPEAA